MSARHKSDFRFRRLAPRRFLRDERGVTAVEFALVLPILIVLVLGCFEVPRYVLVVQKITRTSAGVADLIAQADDPVTGNQIQDIFRASRVMMDPYDIVADGKIFITSINNPSGAGVEITWQRDNSGNAAATSKIGSSGTPAIPAALMPGSDEEVLAAEVFFNYTPIFSTLIYSGSQLYSVSYTRPRNHNLTTVPSAADAPDS